MSKTTLPVNLVDDVLAESMDGKRRYKIIDNGDGTISLEDVSEYLQTGSAFGAGQVNSTNQAVNDSVDKSKVLITLEENAASTDDENVAGSKALAELNKNLDERLYLSFEPTNATSIENAISQLCDALPVKQTFFSGKFKYTDLWYHYFLSRTSANYISGFYVGVASNTPHSFYRLAGADAVTKKLGEPEIVTQLFSITLSFTKSNTSGWGTVSASGTINIAKAGYKSVGVASGDVKYSGGSTGLLYSISDSVSVSGDTVTISSVVGIANSSAVTISRTFPIIVYYVEE